MSTPRTLYERVGGDPFFDDLAARFYRGVRDEPVLVAVYPDTEEELEAARVHLRDFLIQFFGGPAAFSETRGAPRLRVRHLPFAIGPAERDAWVRVMAAAVAEADIGGLDESRMLSYFQMAATSLINVGADTVG